LSLDASLKLTQDETPDPLEIQVSKLSECIEKAFFKISELAETVETLQSSIRILRNARVKAEEDIAILQNQISGLNEIILINEGRLDRISAPLLNGRESGYGLLALRGYVSSHSGIECRRPGDGDDWFNTLEDRVELLEDNKPVTLSTQEDAIIEATILILNDSPGKKLFQNEITKRLIRLGMFKDGMKDARKRVNYTLKRAAKLGQISLEHVSQKKIIVRLTSKGGHE